MLSFMQKWAYLNLEQKLFYLGIFQLEFEKSHCGIWNWHPQIFQRAKFCAKIKILKFRAKNVLFGYF